MMMDAEQVCSDQGAEESHTLSGKTRGRKE